MSFKVLILGSNSSLPAYGRHHTSQYIQIEDQHYLIDCGEGTQYQMLKYGVKKSKIDKIFISHLHGDHYLGLMGVLFSMHLSGRDKDLEIFGPQGLREIITIQLKYSESVLNYKLKITEVSTDQPHQILENKLLSVTSLPLIHRVPCTGFLIKEKPKPRRIKSKSIPKDFEIENFEKLKLGEDIIDDEGHILYKNSHLTLPPKRSRSYAFCSDTGIHPNLAKWLEGVDLMYHEATFLKNKEKWARKTFHATTHDAATVAKEAKAKKLIIGHFSARYRDIQPFVDECQDVFSNTEAAIEGENYEISEE